MDSVAKTFQDWEKVYDGLDSAMQTRFHLLLDYMQDALAKKRERNYSELLLGVKSEKKTLKPPQSDSEDSLELDLEPPKPAKDTMLDLMIKRVETSNIVEPSYAKQKEAEKLNEMTLTDILKCLRKEKVQEDE
jgi:hypothetical protein